MPPYAAFWFFAQATEQASNGSSMLVSLAALVGAATGVSAIVVGYRNSHSAAKKDYVQGNLDSLAAVNERLEEEADRLRERSEQQRIRLIGLESELAETRTELVRVQRECDECLSRIGKLENLK